MKTKLQRYIISKWEDGTFQTWSILDTQTSKTVGYVTSRELADDLVRLLSTRTMEVG